MRLSWLPVCLAVTTGWIFAGPSRGDDRSSGAAGGLAHAEAAERFDRGLARFKAGDHPGALAEFQRAYAVNPHPVVLFNIGLVQAKLDRPVEAVEAFERLLASSGALSAERVGVARRTLDEQRTRVAQLRVTSSAPATIEIDGVEVARTPREEPIKVKAGTRLVAALSPGHLPLRKEITIAGGTTTALDFPLVRTEVQLAQLSIHTRLPEVEVFVDGQRQSRTPVVGSLALEPGRRMLELRRAGYLPNRRELVLGPGASAAVAVELEPLPSGEGPRGRLSLASNTSDFDVAVDGRPRGAYRQPLSLPAGAHRLEVSRAGFVPAERLVTVPENGELNLQLTLAATAETRAAHIARVNARARWGWTTLAAGVAMAGGGAGVVFWNRGPLSKAFDERSRITASYGAGGICERSGGGDHEDCDARKHEAESQLRTRELTRNLGLVATGLGVASAVLGGFLLLTNDDPGRYDHAPSPEPSPIGAVDWQVAPGGEVTLVLGRRF